MNGAKISLAVAALLAMTAPCGAASADPPRNTAARESARRAPIVLVIDSLPPGVDEAALRARLARELGAPLVDAKSSPGARGTLTIDANACEATARFETSDGDLTQRTVVLPSTREEQTSALVLLSGNVARDEAADLRAQLLARGARRGPRESADPDLPHTVHPTGADRSAEPRAPAPSDPTTPPDPAEPRDLAPLARGACSPTPGRSFFFAGADFVPMLGTSLADRHAVLGASLNALGGLSGGVRGLQIGGVLNLVGGPACGLQIGGVANVTHDVRGVQIGGVANVTRDVSGLQIGGVANITHDVRGVQIGGVANITHDVSGLQIGGVTNITRDVSGLQIGTVNVARRVRGAQIGVINVADDSDFSLGVVSVVRRGRSHLDLWGAETGTLTMAFKHGGRRFHNYYGVGIRPIDADPKVAFTFGIGGHLPLTSSIYLDLDGLLSTFHSTSRFAESPALLTQIRALVGLRVAPGLALAAGPSYNVSVAGSDDAAKLSLLGSALFTTGTGPFVRGWPGLSVGLQAF